MFERFTDRARRVVVLAQEEARLLNHNYIGTEHILLGLVREEEGVAARALQSLNIELDDVRRDVLEIVGEGPAAPGGHIPFTPRAKKVLEMSLREGLQLGHNYIGTEHILLGLVREGEGVAAQVLQRRGAALDRVRHTVIQLLSGYTGGTSGEVAAGGGTAPTVGAADFPTFGERLRGRHRELQDIPPERFPICPRCDASLSDTVAVKRVEVTADDEPRFVNIAYCSACGITLGVTLA